MWYVYCSLITLLALQSYNPMSVRALFSAVSFVCHVWHCCESFAAAFFLSVWRSIWSLSTPSHTHKMALYRLVGISNEMSLIKVKRALTTGIYELNKTVIKYCDFVVIVAAVCLMCTIVLNQVNWLLSPTNLTKFCTKVNDTCTPRT